MLGRLLQQNRHGKIRLKKTYINLPYTQNGSFTVPYLSKPNLLVYSLYEIGVLLVNDNGEGPKSTAFTARTLGRDRLISQVRHWKVYNHLYVR